MNSLSFIKKVLNLRKEYSIRELAKKFELSTQTIQNWSNGKLPVGKRNKPNAKLDLKLLQEDVESFPDSYQYERAKRLGVGTTCINDNLKKLGITYKKNTKTSESRRRKAIIISKKD